MLDYDYYNEVNREEKEYRKYVVKEKNRILHIHDFNRKMKAWRHLFPALPKDANDTVY